VGAAPPALLSPRTRILPMSSRSRASSFRWCAPGWSRAGSCLRRFSCASSACRYFCTRRPRSPSGRCCISSGWTA